MTTDKFKLISLHGNNVTMVENIPTDLIVKSIKSEIQSAACSKRFIDWQESGSFSASLEHIVPWWSKSFY